MTRRIVTVTNTTLFHVAALWLGDATAWDRIAALNLLTDTTIVGTITLMLPPPSSAQATTIGSWA